MGKYTYDWPMAALSSTVVPYYVKPAGDIKLLTVVRKFDPFKGKLCFPGGFLNLKDEETIEEAASRELQEETSINIAPLFFKKNLITVHSAPDRDPRGRIIDFSFAIRLIEEQLEEAKPSDDADSISIITIPHIEGEFLTFEDNIKSFDLAFDHEDILREFMKLEGFELI